MTAFEKASSPANGGYVSGFRPQSDTRFPKKFKRPALNLLNP